MNFQTTKLELMKHLLNVKQQFVLDRLSEILLSDEMDVEKDLSPMTIEELNNRIDISENDFKNEKKVVYSTNGKAFTKEQYTKHVNSISEKIRHGAKTSTTKEVKNFIFNS